MKWFIFFLIAIVFFISCQEKKSEEELLECTKIQLSDADFKLIPFRSVPEVIKDAVINLALVEKKMDTVLSFDSNIVYSYSNPGAGKGYIEQVMKDRDMHMINGWCYEFLLYSKPYIIFNDTIYSLDQGLGMNCSGGDCVMDTTGINEITSLYALPLRKIMQP